MYLQDLRLLKMPDMFRFALLKFYFKVMNNILTPCFENMKPVLPRICDNYGIRRPSFHLSLIKHDFAEQLRSYQLSVTLTILNSIQFNSYVYFRRKKNASMRLSLKLFIHSFSDFSYYL